MSGKHQPLLVYQSNTDGHHLPYLQRILGALVETDQKILVGTCPELADTVGKHALAANPSVQIITAPRASSSQARTPTGYVRHQFSSYAHLCRLSRSVLAAYGAHHTFVPHIADIFLPCSALRGRGIGSSFSGILMNSNFHHAELQVDTEERTANRRVSDCTKAILFKRLIRSRNCVSLLVLDPLLESWMSRNAPDAAPKLKFLPDPAKPIDQNLRASARIHFGIDRDDLCIVLVFGALDARRKNVRVLLEAAAQRPRIGVLLVGLFHSSLVQELEGRHAAQLVAEGRLFTRNAYVTSDVEDLAYAAADRVWLNYSEHRNMSGVLVKAARARRLTILSRHGLLGWYGTSRSVGLVVESDDVKSVLKTFDCGHNGDEETAALVDKAEREFSGFGEEEFTRQVRAAVG